MKVDSVIAQKGGAGKTTLSLATASNWGHRRRSRPPVVLPAQPSRLARILEAATGQGVDLAVVDTAPPEEQSAVAAAKAADLLVVPCRPAVFDLEIVSATLDVVRAIAPGAPVLCVLNGVPPREPRQAPARQALAGYRQVNLNPLFVGANSFRANATYQRLRWHVDQWNLQEIRQLDSAAWTSAT